MKKPAWILLLALQDYQGITFIRVAAKSYLQ